MDPRRDEGPPARAGGRGEPRGAAGLSRPVAVAAAVATLAVTGWLGARELGRSPALGSAEVPSYWNEVPMTCETTEIELEHRKLETFRCDYEGAAAPPPGRYDHTETVWYSDIDGRRARQHDIVITPSGSVTGWAAY